MPTLILRTDKHLTLDVSVEKDNEHPELALVKFENNFNNNLHRIDRLSLTANHMELLGKFLIRQANELRIEEKIRKKTITE